MNKHYKLYAVGNLWKIKFEGGGEVSPKLSGSYTSPKEAMYAIEEYESQKPASRKANRSVKNGESESTT